MVQFLLFLHLKPSNEAGNDCSAMMSQAQEIFSSTLLMWMQSILSHWLVPRALPSHRAAA